MRLTTRNDSPLVSGHPSRLSTAALVAGALLIVFGLDRTTGAAPVQHLYYLPIILAGIRLKAPGGAVAAVAAILLYHAANPHLLTFKYEESDVVQITLFVAVGLIAAKLAQDADRLHHLALTDDLTGLHNLRSFEAHLAAMVRESRATHTPLALLVVDVDRLKSLNDQHGHLTGAEAVRTVGHIIGRRLPPAAVACRYGGDEFAIALPRCTVAQAEVIATDLGHEVDTCAPVLAGHAFEAGTLSISIGGTSSFDRHATERKLPPDDVEAGEALFREADAALYRAKADGRNRVCVTDRPDDNPMRPQ